MQDIAFDKTLTRRRNRERICLSMSDLCKVLSCLVTSQPAAGRFVLWRADHSPHASMPVGGAWPPDLRFQVRARALARRKIGCEECKACTL